MKRHYPKFNELLGSIADHRERKSYDIAEIIMAGLALFIFKRGSRNNADKGHTTKFEDNYIKLFGLRLPVMETVNTFLKGLPPEELVRLKQILVKQLIKRRVLDKYRFNGSFIVAVDGTGVFSFDKEPFPGCPHKTSKNGKTTWQAYVLEAKILCSNKFSISIATEWIDNSIDISKKQDCEQKAFVRLAKKLKTDYPRLPIIIAADSLYPNNTVFNICENNKWGFILTFKEGVLKSVWEEVNLIYPLSLKQNQQTRRCFDITKKIWFDEISMFVNNIQYKEHSLNWVEYIRDNLKDGHEKKRFVHITNFKVNKKNVWNLSFHGRLRWKIENEGFNTQKNGGYNMQHKYSQKNFTAMQNYYQLMQIAHLINQLTELTVKVKDSLKKAGHTLKSIWEDVVASMKKEVFTTNEITKIYNTIRHIKY